MCMICGLFGYLFQGEKPLGRQLGDKIEREFLRRLGSCGQNANYAATCGNKTPSFAAHENLISCFPCWGTKPSSLPKQAGCNRVHFVSSNKVTAQNANFENMICCFPTSRVPKARAQVYQQNLSQATNACSVHESVAMLRVEVRTWQVCKASTLSRMKMDATFSRHDIYETAQVGCVWRTGIQTLSDTVLE